MASSRERNSRGQGELLRAEIIASAAALIAEYGTANAVTLRAVARGAGVSAPAIYAHFANPQEIVLAVVAQEFEVLSETVHAAVQASAHNARQRLLACCNAYLRYAQEHPKQYSVMFGGIWDAVPAMAQDLVTRSDVGELGQLLLGELIGLLQEAIDAGESESSDSRSDGITLWVGMHGLAHQRIVSTVLDWPSDIQSRLVHRLAYLKRK